LLHLKCERIIEIWVKFCYIAELGAAISNFIEGEENHGLLPCVESGSYIF